MCGKADLRLSVGAVGSMATLGCDLAKLVLGEIGEVGRFGIGHFDRERLVFGDC